MTFYNREDRLLEGDFVLELPEGAAASGFGLDVGDVIVGSASFSLPRRLAAAWDASWSHAAAGREERVPGGPATKQKTRLEATSSGRMARQQRMRSANLVAGGIESPDAGEYGPEPARRPARDDSGRPQPSPPNPDTTMSPASTLPPAGGTRASE